MVNLFYLFFIVACLLYFLFSHRKEVPFVILIHALLQYLMTLSFWVFQMNNPMAGLLLGFIFASTILLIWARGLNYSRELHSIQLFFSVSQWMAIVAVGLFISLKSPFYYLIPSSAWHSNLNAHQMSIHPVIKLCGNLLLFTTFFHLILNWGSRWSVRKSLIDIGPLLIYLGIIAVLRVFQATTQSVPFS
ncbi:MAG: hypothetical protein SF052_13775 [Bacteroidia bacterium]|nr:hypothetical protein [Bacteroidia bacterium]